MSSREQSFSVIALFLLEKRAGTFFHNSEVNSALQNHLLVSVLKSSLQYSLAGSSAMVHHW